MSPMTTMTTEEMLAWFAAHLNEWFPQKRAELQAQQARLAKRAKPDVQKTASAGGTSFLEIAFIAQETANTPPAAEPAFHAEIAAPEFIIVEPENNRAEEAGIEQEIVLPVDAVVEQEQTELETEAPEPGQEYPSLEAVADEPLPLEETHSPTSATPPALRNRKNLT